jgi:hypothetical protein
MVLIRFHRNLKKVLVAWYSPKKQKLNNYDVIESYAEDFTRLNYYEHRGTINRTSNKIVITESKTYSRDNKDELAGQIGELKTEVAVLKATRPYQDALIQCDIRRVAEHADFNLWRRTCRMISGEVVLPNTPTVTGYASYNPCDCRNNSTQTPAA